MNSGSEPKLSDIKKVAEQNLGLASKPTACVAITEQNWKALLTALHSQLQMMEHVITTEEMAGYLQQLQTIFDKEVSWLEKREQNYSRMLKDKTEEQIKELEQQAGKLREQFASDMEKYQKDLQAQMDGQMKRLTWAFTRPVLLLTLVLAVFVLLQTLGI